MLKLILNSGFVGGVVGGLIVAMVMFFSGPPAVTNFAGTTNLSGLTLSGGASDEGLVISSGTATSTISAQGVVNYWVQSGIDFAFVQIPMAATSSVICSIPNPFGAATSTVNNPMVVQITSNGIAQAQNIFISTSTTNAASSTVAWSGAIAVAASAQISSFFMGNMASSTLTAGANDVNILPGLQQSGNTNRFLGPNEFLNVRIGTTTAGTYTAYYTGTCSATFMKP